MGVLLQSQDSDAIITTTTLKSPLDYTNGLKH